MKVKGCLRTVGHSVLVLVTLVAVVVPAAAVELMPTIPCCIPTAGLTPLHLTVSPATAFSQVRVYFRECVSAEDESRVEADGDVANPHDLRRCFEDYPNEPLDAYYFLEMRQSAADMYWTVLPRPECGTDLVKLYFSVLDKDGVSTETKPFLVPVVDGEDECTLELTEQELRVGESQVIAETNREQQDSRVLGFCCEGILSRINLDGTLRRDAVCNDELQSEEGRCACGALLWWDRTWVPWVVLAGGGGVITTIRTGDKPEASPSRP